MPGKFAYELTLKEGSIYGKLTSDRETSIPCIYEFTIPISGYPIKVATNRIDQINSDTGLSLLKIPVARFTMIGNNLFALPYPYHTKSIDELVQRGPFTKNKIVWKIVELFKERFDFDWGSLVELEHLLETNGINRPEQNCKSMLNQFHAAVAKGEAVLAPEPTGDLPPRFVFDGARFIN